MADPTTPDTRLTLTRIIEVALHEELSKYSNLSAMALRSRDVSRRLADAVVAAPELLQLADESSRLREALEEGIRALEARGMAYASNRLRAALMPPSPEPR